MTEGEEAAFGGYIGGRLVSITQSKQESDDDAWIERREVNKSAKKGRSYAEMTRLGGNINAVGINKLKGEWEVM